MLVNSSSDSKYFSRVLNLYFSLLYNNEKECKLKVWDLGMTKFQIGILKKLKIDVIKIPKFVDHWNLCYTWKPYIYKYSNESIFLYLDAGCTINKDLSRIFELIENDGYFFVSQGQQLKDIIPTEFNDLNFLNNKNINSIVFAAGIIGINKNVKINNEIIERIYDLATMGYCLGYSKNEIHRDVTNLNIIRDCSVFRHDQSIVNAVFRKYLDEIVVQDASIYASTSLSSDCIIYNNRKLNYSYFFKNISIAKLFLFIFCYFIDLFHALEYQLNKYINKIKYFVN